MKHILSWLLYVGIPMLVATYFYWLMCECAEIYYGVLLPVFIAWQICWAVGVTGLWCAVRKR